MKDEEVTEIFNDMVEAERITNHPAYVQLMLELDVATMKLFRFIERMGVSDVRSVKSVFICPKGHMHDLFQHIDLSKMYDHDDEA